jgi:hypothetical protein
VSLPKKCERLLKRHMGVIPYKKHLRFGDVSSSSVEIISIVPHSSRSSQACDVAFGEFVEEARFNVLVHLSYGSASLERDDSETRKVENSAKASMRVLERRIPTGKASLADQRSLVTPF